MRAILEEPGGALGIGTYGGLSRPICAGCKKVRDDKGYRSQIETYVRDHSQADFTHGICPECLKEVAPDLADGQPGNPQA